MFVAAVARVKVCHSVRFESLFQSSQRVRILFHNEIKILCVFGDAVTFQITLVCGWISRKCESWETLQRSQFGQSM